MEIKTVLKKSSFSSIGVWRWVFSTLILLFFLLPNLLISDLGFRTAVLSVLSHPQSPLAHLELAEAAVAASDWSIAKQEFTIANLLSKQDKSSNDTELNLKFSAVESAVFAEEELREEIREWKNVLKTQPGYRDGYLQLALLHYKLSEDFEALKNWQEAWRLDPNNEQVAKMGDLLKTTDY